MIAARSAGSVAKIVTGFTLAHSLTLGLGAAGLVHLPRAPVEIAIALSIAWVGAANLFASGARAAQWPVAVFFGLVHGLGFSEALAGAEMPAGAFAAALALFNCGVEAGQLMLLLLVLPPLAWLRERAPGFHRAVVVRGGSVAILAAGRLMGGVADERARARTSVRSLGVPANWAGPCNVTNGNRFAPVVRRVGRFQVVARGFFTAVIAPSDRLGPSSAAAQL